MTRPASRQARRPRVQATVGALARTRAHYGEGWAGVKLGLLRGLARTRLPSARWVIRLHEELAFLRAYPDDARVLAQVERMLAGFARRPDFRQHRAALADSGLAGAPIRYRFFWPTARWLAERFGDRLHLDRQDGDAADKIAAALGLLAPWVDAVTLREIAPSGFLALDRLRQRGETDAAFFLGRLGAMPGDTFTREAVHDAIDASYVLGAGPGTPSRTLARDPAAPVVFQIGPLRHARPDLREEIRRPPRAVCALPRSAGRRLVDLARGAMVTRARDLDAFAYGNPRDVHLVEDDGGRLRFAVIGVLPERRALLPAVFGILTLCNGVPIGYAQVDVLGRTAAVSFNTFETYRGGEAAFVFARVLAMTRHLFGAESFSIEPYQLGHGNEEGIESGAWWFYYKLGFRPRATAARRLAWRERGRLRQDPSHRSSRETLRQLAAWHLFFDLDPSRRRGLPPAAPLGLRVARTLATRDGPGHRRAAQASARQAMRLCGLESLAGFSPDERRAWTRWSPLVAALPGVSRWSRADRQALVAVVRAKGGPRERDFAVRFAAHPKLGPALLRERWRPLDVDSLG